MTHEHPITPPPELFANLLAAALKKLGRTIPEDGGDTRLIAAEVAIQAARWGADQELEWCVSYVDNNVSGNKARALRALRRPKPPSLKEQSIALIDKIQDNKEMWDIRDLDVIRQALKSLPS